jgi:hypothetical protein
MTAAEDTYLAEWGLTPEDDTFHPVDDSPWLTETVWMAWFVPERKMVGYFYPVFRPNLGIQAGGVLVYDDTAELPWELPVFEYDWHRQLPAGTDLRNAKLDNGMTIRCIEPARKFALGYESRDFSLTLDVEGVIRPLVTHTAPPFNKGHIDQICRMTGEMVIRGETIPIDSLAMRDRSWGPRQDGRQPTVGYDYATADEDNAFLAVSVSKAYNVWDVTMGFHIRDGVWSKVTGGRREVERDADGRPTVLTIEATDELGRTVHARGETVNHQVFTAYPSMLALNSLVDWEFDDRRGWGEDQDCWHPRRWQQFRSAERR